MEDRSGKASFSGATFLGTFEIGWAEGDSSDRSAHASGSSFTSSRELCGGEGLKSDRRSVEKPAWRLDGVHVGGEFGSSMMKSFRFESQAVFGRRGEEI